MLRIYIKNSALPVSVVVADTVKYGYLYNYYAASDARELTASGWELPTLTNLNTLRDYVGGFAIAGGMLKNIGTVYWSSNVGATNAYNFNARGSGYRTELGNFQFFRATMAFGSITTLGGTSIYYMQISGNSIIANTNYAAVYARGVSLRPIKTSTTLINGESGIYVGNDGRAYRTICIGTQEWVADNLAETKFRNGDLITKVTDGTAWAALTTEGYCAYDNDESNV